MPYVTCPRCALTAYTAARWTTTDDCPACGTPLTRAEQARSGRAAGSAMPLSQAFQNTPAADHTSRVSAG